MKNHAFRKQLSGNRLRISPPKNENEMNDELTISDLNMRLEEPGNLARAFLKDFGSDPIKSPDHWGDPSLLEGGGPSDHFEGVGLKVLRVAAATRGARIIRAIRFGKICRPFMVSA